MAFRRGITPVISIILLISILIGSVGMLQAYVGEFDVDTSALGIIELTQATEIDIRTAYEDEEGDLRLVLHNSGDRAINFEDEMVMYINELDYQSYDSLNDDFDLENAGCLDVNLDIGQSTSDISGSGCKTGLEFPSAFEEPVNIEFQHIDSHKSWSYTCDVKSQRDSTC